jgi:hypothetical protein
MSQNGDRILSNGTGMIQIPNQMTHHTGNKRFSSQTFIERFCEKRERRKKGGNLVLTVLEDPLLCGLLLVCGFFHLNL